MKFDCDICVVGAGAAGLLAAAAAANSGASVLLLEKNRRVGVKILASGGTHCNVTSTLTMPELGRAFGVRGERFLRGALFGFGPEAVRSLLLDQGVPTTEQQWEKVFPTSMRASDVHGALLRHMNESGADLRLNSPVRTIEPGIDGGFCIESPTESLRCKRVIVTTGGCSFPKTGTTGDAYPWLEAMGHTVTPLRPALVPLVVKLDWVRSLTGIAIEGALVRVTDTDGKTLLSRRRPVLFTHRGISGPGAMDASGVLGEAPSKRRLTIDWIPDVDVGEVQRRLSPIRGDDRPILHRLDDLLPRRLITALMTEARIDPTQTPSQLRKNERNLLVESLKACHIPVAGNEGFAKAEVTAGGILLDEVSPRTMESRKVPGLYLAGEVLDLDALIGGFSFQLAFSTGQLAGESAASF